ncbi:MAG: tRNA (guanosine(37)-N1)-methyltransferase TrmD [Candidatus Campbellbacteria bacterium]|nr:tRNA (guanosine(37)-N1)-methyltransferase TrmD [Candidatus Campbellbacteria bacterium]
MKCTVITLFPESIESYVQSSILKRAQEKKLLSVSFINPRTFTTDKHHKTDDKPYGGGPGMVMKAEPILKAIESVQKKRKNKKERTKIIFFSPTGKQFTNVFARTLAKRYDHIICIAGRYEGVDARVRRILKAEDISIGPYVLTGGEIPALVVIDSVARHIKGVLGAYESLEEKRIASRDVYTRPDAFVWKGKSRRVPAVLSSGHHKNIDNWRKNTHKK